MRNNPDDLANQLIQKVKDYLQEEVDNTELDEGTMESAYDGILVGRKELAESLLLQMEKWETEEEQGTVYTGDAPSTEASFYKKNKVNSATVIDLVVDILTEAKKYIPLSPKFAMKAYDKIDEAIQELKDHLTTVQTEDLDNQSYSEGERYDNE
jgi:hypothetical protein